MDFTPIARHIFASRARRTENWSGHVEDLQRIQLMWLLRRASDTEIGRKYGFKDIILSADPVAEYRKTCL